MKKILLTGGGTAGHVMPHLALIPYLKEAHYHIDYMGSYKGIEKTLITKENIPYYGIASGKLRRYFDFKNITDIFRIFWGTLQATAKIARLKPHVVFSKGGFVTVPVVIGAWLNRVPIIVHESDMTPGLANKIALKFAKKICTTFEKTVTYVPAGKGVYTGSPIRGSLLQGHRDQGLAFTGFTGTKPVLMMTGGSLGAKALNDTLRLSLDQLALTYDIVHLCGKGNADPSLEGHAAYRQYDFVGPQMPDIYAMSDIIISRAGSNTITEILALKKPNLLIPLPASQSRGDQIMNAAAYSQAGYSAVLDQESMTPSSFCQAIDTLYADRQTYIDAMNSNTEANGTKAIFDVIDTII